MHFSLFREAPGNQERNGASEMERGIRNDEGIRKGTGQQKQNKALECSGTPEAPEMDRGMRMERDTQNGTTHQNQNGTPETKRGTKTERGTRNGSFTK
jgi:hypothetical protein